MRQKEVTLGRGLLLIFFFVWVQALLGRWMIWSRFVPEGDLALVFVLALCAGRTKGAFFGGAAGGLRGLFALHPFKTGVFVLGALGFFSGLLGEKKRLRPWQKTLFLLFAVLGSDLFFLFFTREGMFGPPGILSAHFREAALPSAVAGAFIGRLLISLF